MYLFLLSAVGNASYQHIETGRYIHIDGRNGYFYDLDRKPISAKEGLDFAMPVGEMHSQSFVDKVELNIEQGYGLGL